MIKIENLTFGYSKPIFKNANLLLKTDKITLLTGENGSGKTTLLRLISGLNKNYIGKIYINSKDIKSLTIKEIADKLIYIKQEPLSNIVAGTPKEDLEIWQQRFINYTKDDKLIEHALRKFGLLTLQHTPIWKLSGGQQAKIPLSALLLFPKKYWMLDEPESGLDKESLNTLFDILKSKKENRTGAIIATHNIALYEQIADSVVQINELELVL